MRAHVLSKLLATEVYFRIYIASYKYKDGWQTRDAIHINYEKSPTPPLDQILPKKSRKYNVPTVSTYSYLNTPVNRINGKNNCLQKMFSTTDNGQAESVVHYVLWGRGDHISDGFQGERGGGQSSPTKCIEGTIKNSQPTRSGGGVVIRISQSLSREIGLSWHNQNNQNDRKKVTVCCKMIKIVTVY